MKSIRLRFICSMIILAQRLSRLCVDYILKYGYGVLYFNHNLCANIIIKKINLRLIDFIYISINNFIPIWEMGVIHVFIITKGWEINIFWRSIIIYGLAWVSYILFNYFHKLLGLLLHMICGYVTRVNSYDRGARDKISIIL